MNAPVSASLLPFPALWVSLGAGSPRCRWERVRDSASRRVWSRRKGRRHHAQLPRAAPRTVPSAFRCKVLRSVAVGDARFSIVEVRREQTRCSRLSHGPCCARRVFLDDRRVMCEPLRGVAEGPRPPPPAPTRRPSAQTPAAGPASGTTREVARPGSVLALATSDGSSGRRLTSASSSERRAWSPGHRPVSARGPVAT